MARFSFAFLLSVSLCLAGAAAHSEDLAALSASPSDTPSKPGKRTAAHKNIAAKQAKSQQSAEEADKAARLEEGRKKFFQRSMGFDNGGSGSPVTLQGESGLTPSMGFKF